VPGHDHHGARFEEDHHTAGRGLLLDVTINFRAVRIEGTVDCPVVL
jgi:hypothetical protein